MKVTRIYHSGFCIELDHSTLLFDWYTGAMPEVNTDKPLYVFVSHGHGDHYDQQIWTLREKFPKITYILDQTCIDMHPEAKAQEAASDVQIVTENREYDLPGLHLQTLHSTDMGVAFYVETEGKAIYHAGDLNVWYWNNEPHEENLASAMSCHNALIDLRGKAIDIACVPVDPRLEEHGARGAVMFMEDLGATHVFPMHYGDRKAEAMAYAENDERLKQYADVLRWDDVTVIE